MVGYKHWYQLKPTNFQQRTKTKTDTAYQKSSRLRNQWLRDKYFLSYSGHCQENIYAWNFQNQLKKKTCKKYRFWIHISHVFHTVMHVGLYERWSSPLFVKSLTVHLGSAQMALRSKYHLSHIGHGFHGFSERKHGFTSWNIQSFGLCFPILHFFGTWVFNSLQIHVSSHTSYLAQIIIKITSNHDRAAILWPVACGICWNRPNQAQDNFGLIPKSPPHHESHN